MKSIDNLEKQLISWRNNKEISGKKFSDDVNEVKRLHKLKMKDEFNNGVHLSSYSGLINDPNGLTKSGDVFNIFYQWTPFVPVHKNKHWGHFKTKDFINYTHTGMAIEPSMKEDANGIFSGGGIVEQGKTYVFWTGNIKSFGTKDEDRSSYTLVGEFNDKNKVVNKKALFEVDKSLYTGHFRDPKPFKKNNKFYLLHGAQKLDKTGTLALYESKYVDRGYKFKGSIDINPAIKDSGFMWECPDYIIDGDKEFLVISPQGKSFYEEGNENRDTVIFVPGKLNIDTLVFERSGEAQVIDEGFDFYAPQTISNAKRNLLIGWAGIGEADAFATFKHMWAHNLTLTRRLKLSPNGRISQLPIREYKELRCKEVSLSNSTDLSNRLFEFEGYINSPEFNFRLSNGKEDISFELNQDSFFADRRNMSIDQAPNYGRTRTRKLDGLKNIRVIIDNSLIEIYINDGDFVFTSKYWLEGKIDLIMEGDIDGKGFELKPFNIEWNV